MEENKIVYLKREYLHPHPENPRKTLGDLEELKESIREHGIMQNLTVVPEEGKSNCYKILIGHRRFKASEGILEELPCVIAEGLSEREQVSIMLVENMHRSDLTFMEQAKGFQLMMNLGDSIDEISQKTGFSQTTVRHRLEIAKLSNVAVEKKREWQLTISDLIELEKLDDIKLRNKILADAYDSRNLKIRIENAVNENNIKKNSKIVFSAMKKLGIREYKKGSLKWANDQKKVFECSLCEPVDSSFDNMLKKIDTTKYKYAYDFNQYSGGFYLARLTEGEKTKLSPREVKFRRMQEIRKELISKSKEACQYYADTLLTIKKTDITKKITYPDQVRLLGTLWDICHDCHVYISDNFASLKRRSEITEIYKDMPAAWQMLAHIIEDMYTESPVNYQNDKNDLFFKTHEQLVDILESFGHYFPDEEVEKVITGKSELYQELAELSKEIK